MGRQLVFDLGRAPAFDADDFLVSPSNESAVSAVGRWPEWPSRTILVVGPPGSGKSHLGAIWAATARAVVVANHQPLDVATLWSGAARSVLLDDCDRRPRADAELFHALNFVRERAGWMMLTARTPIENWGLQTPDLVSRLRLADHARIESPDLELVKSVLIKLFADRQIAVDEEVINYAARHCERSLAAISAFVEAVDEASLERGRKITRPLAAATLRLLDGDPLGHGPT